MTRKREGLARLLGRRSFLIVNLCLLLLVAWGFAGEYVRNREMIQEINSLEEKVDEMEQYNAELTQIAEHNSGAGMLEREARLKLNLKKPGEEVVVIRDTNPAVIAAQENITAPRSGASFEFILRTKKESNPIKWLKYFFPSLFEN